MKSSLSFNVSKSFGLKNILKLINLYDLALSLMLHFLKRIVIYTKCIIYRNKFFEIILKACWAVILKIKTSCFKILFDLLWKKKSKTSILLKRIFHIYPCTMYIYITHIYIVNFHHYFLLPPFVYIRNSSEYTILCKTYINIFQIFYKI